MRRLVSMIVATVALAGCGQSVPSPTGMPVPARNSVSTDGKWTYHQPPGAMYSVSCPSPLWCMAGGSAHGSPAFMLFDGTSWTATMPQTNDPWADDFHVDCPSVGFCVATNGLNHGYWMYAGGAWTSEKYLPFVPGRIPTSDPILLACASQTFCMAVASAGEQYAVYNGTTWTLGTYDSGLDRKVPGPLACSGVHLCVLGVTGLGPPGYALLTYDGTKWSVSNRSFAFSFVNGQSQSISCAGDFCLVTGNGLVTSYRGGEWSTPLRVSVPQAARITTIGSMAPPGEVVVSAIPTSGGNITAPPLPGSNGAFVTAVSCPVSGACYLISTMSTIVGSGKDGSVYAIGVGLQTLIDGTLSKPVSLVAKSWDPHAHLPLTGPFSCPTVSYCVMVGTPNPSHPHDQLSNLYAVYQVG